MSQQSGEQTYRVAAWWTSGRCGLAKSDSAPNAIHFTAPKEFGGLEGRWIPEELLLAAVTGCFTTTLRSIANRAEFEFTDFHVEARGTVRRSEFGYGFTEIVISSTLKIACPAEREHALDLLKEAESLCLVSRAIDVPLRFEAQIEVTEPQLSV
jgi:organic hydroperoxide reductase OsmC/OhrA